MWYHSWGDNCTGGSAGVTILQEGNPGVIILQEEFHGGDHSTGGISWGYNSTGDPKKL